MSEISEISEISKMLDEIKANYAAIVAAEKLLPPNPPPDPTPETQPEEQPLPLPGSCRAIEDFYTPARAAAHGGGVFVATRKNKIFVR